MWEKAKEVSAGGFLKSPEMEHLISTHIPLVGTQAPRRNHPEAGGVTWLRAWEDRDLEYGDISASAKGLGFCDHFSPHRVRG